MGAVGLHDWLRSRIGLSAAYIKLVGQEGSLSFMQLTADEEAAYYSKHPKVYQVSGPHLCTITKLVLIEISCMFQLHDQFYDYR